MTVPLESWRAPSVERLEGGLDDGYGLFATEQIDSGEILAIKGGQLVTEATVKANADVINGSHVQVAPDLFITGMTPDEVDKTLVGWNHSCVPNAYVDGHIILRSIRPIGEGEEITTEYATFLDSDTQEFDCMCGNRQHCRDHVKPSEDSKDPEIREKYDGYFADHLARPEAYAGVQLEPVAPGHPLTSWITAKAKRTMDSEIDGVGLVSVDKIKAGELLALKGGRIINAEQLEAGSDIIQGGDMQITMDMFLACLTEEERMAILLGFNHRCDPNSVVGGQIGLFALKDIAEGEPLTDEYATSYYNPNQSFPCTCGSSNCRGVVDTASDWQRPEIQERFKGHFAFFIQDLIDESSRAQVSTE